MARISRSTRSSCSRWTAASTRSATCRRRPASSTSPRRRSPTGAFFSPAGAPPAPGAAPLDTAYIARLNPLDGSVDVVATDHLAVPRAGHQALLLCDGTVLVTGGNAERLVVERYN